MKKAPLEPAEQARQHALRLLKVRPRSESELRDRLAKKGFDAALFGALIEDLKRRGLIDDARFAKVVALQRMASRPVGRRLLIGDLRARGISPELADAAADQATDGFDELETARKLAADRIKRMRSVSPDAARRRLSGFLVRRGFSPDVVFQIVRELDTRDEEAR